MQDIFRWNERGVPERCTNFQRGSVKPRGLEEAGHEGGSRLGEVRRFKLAKNHSMPQPIILEAACSAYLIARAVFRHKLDRRHIHLRYRTHSPSDRPGELNFFKPVLPRGRNDSRGHILRLWSLCAPCAENNDPKESSPSSPHFLHQLWLD